MSRHYWDGGREEQALAILLLAASCVRTKKNQEIILEALEQMRPAKLTLVNQVILK